MTQNGRRAYRCKDGLASSCKLSLSWRRSSCSDRLVCASGKSWGRRAAWFPCSERVSLGHRLPSQESGWFEIGLIFAVQFCPVPLLKPSFRSSFVEFPAPRRRWNQRHISHLRHLSSRYRLAASRYFSDRRGRRRSVSLFPESFAVSARFASYSSTSACCGSPRASAARASPWQISILLTSFAYQAVYQSFCPCQSNSRHLMICAGCSWIHQSQRHHFLYQTSGKTAVAHDELELRDFHSYNASC